MKERKDGDLMEKIVSLCKRRGFVYPGSEIYGGLSNSWDYGPLGTELKNNIKKSWWSFFVHQRDDMYGIDSTIIMNPKVWEASGHLGAGFSDYLVECKKCHNRFRADAIGYNVPKIEKNEKVDSPTLPECPNCGSHKWVNARQFNLMFKTFIGPAEESANVAYLRPETAQGMFVNFKQILDSMSPKLPFGIAQIGKAFRNEITPGNFIFRTREFEQMEIEYFIDPKDDWDKSFDYWLSQMKEWMKKIGINIKHIHDLEVPPEERAHYSKRTVDIEFDFPFGKKELFGIAYRGDFDLKNHQEKSGQDLNYFDEETKEKFLPHVIEPTFGVDRAMLAILSSAYSEEKDRVVLKLEPHMAPYKAAVFPLLRNKPDLVKAARKIYEDLKKDFMVVWDDRGNIGKRYYSQDEIGTPYCFTVDFQTLEDKTVTVRDRDTMKQDRIAIGGIHKFLEEELK